MPTYEYQREDGTTFEVMQRISEQPLTHCPETGQPVRRIIGGGAGLIFKGSGFYLTDYARKGNGHSTAESPAASQNGKKAQEKKPEAASSAGG